MDTWVEELNCCDFHNANNNCDCFDPNKCDFHECCRAHNKSSHKVRYCINSTNNRDYCINRLGEKNIHFCDKCFEKINIRRKQLINKRKLLLRRLNMSS